MYNTIKERLTAYLECERISKTEFGKRIGVSNAFVSSVKQSISTSKLECIKREFPNLNIEWLLFGNGEMLLSENKETQQASDMANTNVKTRLLKYLKTKGMTQAAFCRKIGVSVAYVGSIRRSIDKDKLRIIAEYYPDLNQNWLLYGEGDMIANEPQKSPTNMLEKMLDEIISQRSLLAKSQEQIDRLLNIIEKNHFIS